MVYAMGHSEFVCVAGVRLSQFDLLRIVRPAEAARLGGVSRMTLHRMVRDGRLPPPLRLGAGVVGWPLAAILRSFGMMAEKAVE